MNELRRFGILSRMFIIEATLSRIAAKSPPPKSESNGKNNHTHSFLHTYINRMQLVIVNRTVIRIAV